MVDISAHDSLTFACFFEFDYYCCFLAEVVVVVFIAGYDPGVVWTVAGQHVSRLSRPEAVCPQRQQSGKENETLYIDSAIIYRVTNFVSQLFKNTVAPAMTAAPSTLTWSGSSSSAATASTSSSAAAASDSNSISLAFNNSIAEVMALAAEANANKTASAKEKDLLAATMAAASAAAALGLQQPGATGGAAKVPDVTITSKAKSKQSSAGGVAGKNCIQGL